MVALGNLASRGLAAASKSGLLQNALSGNAPQPLYPSPQSLYPRIPPSGPQLPALQNNLSRFSTQANNMNAGITPSFPSQNVIRSSKGGMNISTYFLIADIIVLLIGVILIVASQSKCKDDPTGTQCTIHKNWGIGITSVASVLFIIILFFKFR